MATPSIEDLLLKIISDINALIPKILVEIPKYLPFILGEIPIIAEWVLRLSTIILDPRQVPHSLLNKLLDALQRLHDALADAARLSPDDQRALLTDLLVKIDALLRKLRTAT